METITILYTEHQYKKGNLNYYSQMTLYRCYKINVYLVYHIVVVFPFFFPFLLLLCGFTVHENQCEVMDVINTKKM